MLVFSCCSEHPIWGVLSLPASSTGEAVSTFLVDCPTRMVICLGPFCWCKIEGIRACLELPWLPLCLTVLRSAGPRHCQITIMFSLQPWRGSSRERKQNRDPGPSMFPCLVVGSITLMSQMGNSTDSDDGKQYNQAKFLKKTAQASPSAG